MKISEKPPTVPLSQVNKLPQSVTAHQPSPAPSPFQVVAFGQQLLANLELTPQAITQLQSQMAQGPLGALLTQLLSQFNFGDKPANSQSVKELLEQLLSFRPLNQAAATTPLNSSFNLLFFHALMGKLSPEAARILAKQMNQKQLPKELSGKDTSQLGNMLSKLSSQIQTSQMASQSQDNPADPTFFSFPLQQNGELSRVEARLTSNASSDENEQKRGWQLRMLLPINHGQHILAHIHLDTGLSTQIHFYCPNQSALEQLNEHLNLFEQRLHELGLSQLTLQSQLGRVPETLQQTDPTRLNIRI